MKNREVLPVGTRVRIAHAKLSTREGTVVQISECGSKMSVQWDGIAHRSSYFTVPELVAVKKP